MHLLSRNNSSTVTLWRPDSTRATHGCECFMHLATCVWYKRALRRLVLMMLPSRSRTISALNTALHQSSLPGETLGEFRARILPAIIDKGQERNYEQQARLLVDCARALVAPNEAEIFRDGKPEGWE